MKPKPVPTLDEFQIEMFWEKVSQSDSKNCWEFTGERDRQGYGNVYIQSNNKKHRHRAHRIAWSIINGPIPDGLNILHKCDNQPCCNPDHLRLGNHSDNMRDMAEKRRGTSGEKSWTAKLTAQDVLDIRRKYVPYKYHSGILAKEYGVHPTTINYLLLRKSWDHIP